ncbi:EamA family transporter [Facklamia sp. 7083-14-GEN3]|uniref:EamA family transporter n=1 Tax=Facklamia sp. 7083-14-GEN3 TaxID=2973478 RepID=UPI00215C63B9|nr:EamA family transporter [Facklamia sp. 7083-14-GEN3]MCR8969787.1 hypothetical protein [Facklamia sp. 7083-14-GEN3]
MNSYFYIILFSTLSAMTRGLISVIDRYQIGYKKQSVLKVNFLNNLYTLLFIIIALFYINVNQVFTMVLDYKIIIYSVLVQIVAVGYSKIFKRLSIFESAIVSKIADFFIPLALFFTTGKINFGNYFISILTTLIVIIWVKKKSDLKTLLQGVMIIVPPLVIQACLSPVLVGDYKKNMDSLILFTVSTLILRFVVSFISMLPTLKWMEWKQGNKNYFNKLYFFRAILTCIAQITFVFVTSSNNSSIAWIFLNITSLYGVIFSNLILKESKNKTEIYIIITVSAITILSQLFF